MWNNYDVYFEFEIIYVKNYLYILMYFRNLIKSNKV